MNENKKNDVERPLITVLMALYNGGEYLRQSVKSVLDQTYCNFEFLIINDCSTDHSLEVIESFHDNRIKIHHNTNNCGQAQSLNVGLRLASGKYIARIDADDIAFPKWLEDQYTYIERNPEYAVVSTKAVVIDENNRVRRTYDSPIRQEDIILRSFTFSPINHVGCIFNKEIILKNEGYVEKYKIAADYGLWSNLIRNGHKITSTKKSLIAIRAHSKSLSRAASGSQELSDLSDIMRGNINKFTDSEITGDESIILCKAFFDEGSLNNFEFNQALNLLKRIYNGLLPTSRIDGKNTQRWSKQRRLAAYLKRVFYFIKNKDYPLVKDTLRKGKEEFGLLSPIGILLMVYFVGRMFLKYIPNLYEKFSRIKAYFMTKNKLKIAGLL